jgi:hypothetical protein
VISLLGPMNSLQWQIDLSDRFDEMSKNWDGGGSGDIFHTRWMNGHNFFL